LTSFKGLPQNELNEEVKTYYKPWKENSQIDVPVVVDDYDEHRKASEPRQLIYDA
jgi:hypothetical protein